MKITEVINRTFMHDLMNKRIIARTKSFERYTKEDIENHPILAGTGRWANCLYLEFLKEDFPHFLYPEFHTDNIFEGKKSFDYGKSDFAQVDFHWGITFYSEQVNPETDKTLVTIGCDYQHMDDHYFMAMDTGIEILRDHGPKAIESFLEIYEHRLQELEGV